MVFTLLAPRSPVSRLEPSVSFFCSRFKLASKKIFESLYTTCNLIFSSTTTLNKGMSVRNSIRASLYYRILFDDITNNLMNYKLLV